MTTKTKKRTTKKTPSNNNRQQTFNREEVNDIVFNALLTRAGLLDNIFDSRRDLNDECGYLKTGELTITQFRELYDREPIAARVVSVYPDECWKVCPSVYETEDLEETTEFEFAWNQLSLSLTGQSKYKQERGSQIWEYLKRGDELSGVGFYGVVLLGLDDGLSLENPAEPRQDQKLLFMRVFDQSLAEIVSYENDVTNPRYGQPTFYNLTFNDPNDSVGGIGVQNLTKKVHWTRVIHLADNLTSSEIFGVPRMRPVYNRLYDLRKLYGGSAEMYWKGAFPGISLETHPQLGGNVTVDRTSLKDDITNYMNGLQRYLSLTGMSANSLAPQVVDPTPQINTQIESICIQLGIPKRIFMGSERGQLASSQDDSHWNERVRGRQDNYLTPRIIVPFIDRLIYLGVLPEPTEYSVVWPDLEYLSADEKSKISVNWTDAIIKYAQGGAEPILTPLDFYTRILGMSDDEASQILESAEESFILEDKSFEEPEEEPESSVEDFSEVDEGEI